MPPSNKTPMGLIRKSDFLGGGLFEEHRKGYGKEQAQGRTGFDERFRSAE